MLQLNGNELAPGFQSRLNALSLRLESMGYPAIGVASGKRSKVLQEQIFRDRYRRQDTGTGPFNDVRWWDGNGDGVRERWVRVKEGGTVLPPGDSTHEDPPATGADLAWPYNNRYTAAHAALLSICEEYGIRWTGRSFGEDWHYDDIWNPYISFAAGAAQPFEEDDVSYANDPDLQARFAQVVEYMRMNFEGMTALIKAESDEQIAAANAKIDEARNQLAGWTRDDANAIRGAISGLSIAGTDPVKIAEALAPLIPKGASAEEVIDALAKRVAR